MNMRPLIIDDNLSNRVSELIAYAEKHPYSMDDLLDIYNSQLEPPGDDPNRVINTDFGYRIVYSVELQPAGKVRHLSMSVNEDKVLPNKVAVDEIMKLFGFDESNRRMIAVKEISPNRNCVEVLEIFE